MLDAAAKAVGFVAGTVRPSFDTDSLEHGYSDLDRDQRRTLKDCQKTVVDALSKLDTPGSLYLETDFFAREATVVVRVKAPSKHPKRAHSSHRSAASNHKALMLLPLST